MWRDLLMTDLGVENMLRKWLRLITGEQLLLTHCMEKQRCIYLEYSPETNHFMFCVCWSSVFIHKLPPNDFCTVSPESFWSESSCDQRSPGGGPELPGAEHQARVGLPQHAAQQDNSSQRCRQPHPGPGTQHKRKKPSTTLSKQDHTQTQRPPMCRWWCRPLSSF